MSVGRRRRQGREKRSNLRVSGERPGRRRRRRRRRFY